MPPREPYKKPPVTPHEEAASPPVSPEAPQDENEAQGPVDPDAMTLEEFLEDVYYNPFGPPPDVES